MPEVASATLTITPVIGDAQQSITDQLTSAGNSAGEAAGKSTGKSFLGTFGVGVAKGAAAVAGAVGVVDAAIVGAANKTAEYGDKIDKASQKLGVSSTFYQEWDAVLQHSGTSMDSMSATFKKLANASQDATADQVAAFEKLGLSMEQVSSMSTEDLFASVIGGLQGMEEGTERTALATELLGRGSMELGALLNTSAEDTQGMIDKVHDLGGVMSEDAVKSAAEYQDRLQDMKTAFTGLGSSLIGQLLPSMSSLFEKIGDFVSTADLSPITDILGSAIEAFGNFINGIDIEAVGQTFQSVMTGIGEAVSLAWNVIKQVFDSLKKAFGTIGDALGESGIEWADVWGGISEVVQTAADLISAVIEGIAEVIAWLVTQAQTDGTLINAVWENICTAVETAVDVIRGVIDLVTALLHGDWEGAWEAAKGIVDSVWNAIKENVTRTWNAIKSTAASIWNGIKEAVSVPIEALKSKLSSAWESIRNTASSVWQRIKTAITSPIETAKQTIDNIIAKIKGFFPFHIGNFLNLKLPHVTVSGGEAPWGIAGKGKLPSFDVKWYARAMESPYLFSDATLFGAGERGDEILYGRDALMNDIREAVGIGGNVFNITVNNADNPEEFADRLVRQIKLRTRMA